MGAARPVDRKMERKLMANVSLVILGNMFLARKSVEITTN